MGTLRCERVIWPQESLESFCPLDPLFPTAHMSYKLSQTSCNCLQIMFRHIQTHRHTILRSLEFINQVEGLGVNMGPICSPPRWSGYRGLQESWKDLMEGTE